jgi:hypothetical protein
VYYYYCELHPVRTRVHYRVFCFASLPYKLLLRSLPASGCNIASGGNRSMPTAHTACLQCGLARARRAERGAQQPRRERRATQKTHTQESNPTHTHESNPTHTPCGPLAPTRTDASTGWHVATDQSALRAAQKAAAEEAAQRRLQHQVVTRVSQPLNPKPLSLKPYSPTPSQGPVSNPKP